MLGKIYDIKKFAVHDGDGIRTTVFLKGCPLKCQWCHNPEGISFGSDLQYHQKKCISCGACSSVCPVDAHRLIDGKHVFRRDKCIKCGRCSEECPVKALVSCYQEVTADYVVQMLLEDKEFYEQSGGGVTLSGGECLCQADFCAEVLREMKKNNVHCAVDTSGYVTRESIEKVSLYTDVFLYDIKFLDAVMHEKYTGRTNEIILENIQYIDSLGKDIEVRIPIIPTINDGEIDRIGEFLSKLKNLKKVKILAYNNLAGSKYESLGIENIMPAVEPPTEKMMVIIMEMLKSHGLNVER